MNLSSKIPLDNALKMALKFPFTIAVKITEKSALKKCLQNNLEDCFEKSLKHYMSFSKSCFGMLPTHFIFLKKISLFSIIHSININSKSK
jgi:hypothetical protein